MQREIANPSCTDRWKLSPIVVAETLVSTGEWPAVVDVILRVERKALLPGAVPRGQRILIVAVVVVQHQGEVIRHLVGRDEIGDPPVGLLAAGNRLRTVHPGQTADGLWPGVNR